MASTRERNGRFTGLYRDAQGRQRSAGSFGDEKTALKAAEYAEAVANPPKPVTAYPKERRGKITVSAYVPTWLDNQVLEETSRETYQRTADRIVSHLGSMAREDVTPDDVRKMIRALKKSGLRDATVSATLDLARGLLGKEACADVRFRIRDRREMMCATRQQAKAVEDRLYELYEEVGRREGPAGGASSQEAHAGSGGGTRICARSWRCSPNATSFSATRSSGRSPPSWRSRRPSRPGKTGVVLAFDTQSSRKDAIPPALVELVSVNICFAVKSWRSNDGFLGDGSFQAGIRATELRPKRDRGRSLITGVSDAQFELLKWFFIEVDDDTGFDAATDVIARAVADVAPGTAAGARSSRRSSPVTSWPTWRRSHGMIAGRYGWPTYRRGCGSLRRRGGRTGR